MTYMILGLTVVVLFFILVTMYSIVDKFTSNDDSNKYVWED